MKLKSFSVNLCFGLTILLSIFLFQCAGSSDSSEKNLQIEPPPSKGSCNLRPDPGPCRALIVSYYFNHSQNRCESFNYGGCQGSRPFSNLADCEKLCLGK
jgi:hypothetical protein